MAIKPGWSKPSTILFASELPANERAFNFRSRTGQRIRCRSRSFSRV